MKSSRLVRQKSGMLRWSLGGSIFFRKCHRPPQGISSSVGDKQKAFSGGFSLHVEGSEPEIFEIAGRG